MKFLHAPLVSFPTKETFVEAENLNGQFEYPLKINKGFWLSPDEGWIEYSRSAGLEWSTRPTKWYTLSNVRLFHFRSVADYIRAIQMFPYSRTSAPYENKTLVNLLEAYEKFHGWRMDLCRTSGISYDGVIHSQTPLQFYVKDTPAKNLDAALYHITSYKRGRTYSHKMAISQLAKMEQLVLTKIQDYKRGCDFLQHQDMFTSIDYNAMRDAGYDGIYVHKEAIEEARDLPETSRYHYASTVLTFWEVESMCVWRWVFEDI